MTANNLLSSKGILTIDGEELDLSMTLIIGIKTKTGLIIATDGLAAVMIGPDEIPTEPLTNQPKIYQVAPNIVIGISGGMLNHLNQFVSDVSRSIENNKPTSLMSVLKGIEDYIPKLYADRLTHPNFDVTVFIAGNITDKNNEDNGKLMFMLHEHKIYTYNKTMPYQCVGNNGKAYQYLEDHPPKGLSKQKIITILKDTIAETAKTEDDVGGHIFVYEIAKKGVTRLE